MKYPFDPSFRNHALLAVGLGIWIFVFLYFTEPLDVNELSDLEKLIYLPLYGLFGAFSYLLSLIFQHLMFKRMKALWQLKNEVLYNVSFILITFVAMRSYYLYVVMIGEQNPYTLTYYSLHIFLPALLTLFPVVLLGRWGLGKLHEQQNRENMIEIKGDGHYETLRIQLRQLLFVQSSDNYVEVSYTEDGQIKKSLIRTRISDVEKANTELLKTHRSYLINPAHFKSWKSKKSKLFVTLSNDMEVPVSKTFTKSVKEALSFAPK
ncbi:MAG: LytTR family DNA-binding domain-containing protein [Bacteroidota bacterium]